MNLHELYKKEELCDGDVIICTLSDSGRFTVDNEYPLWIGGVVDNNLNLIYLSDTPIQGVEFKLKARPEEFDISKYQFEDALPKPWNIENNGDLNFELGDAFFGITRDDAIAIAKHFKLTGEDL